MDTTHAMLSGNDACAEPYVSRRGFLRAGIAAGLTATAYTTTGRRKVAANAQSGASGEMAERHIAMNVVLVHGAFADASSWGGVISRLQQAGYTVAAVQNPLTSLADDIATTRRVIDAIPGPVVLVGHSDGGAPNVRSLVYIAAFAPDEGETLIDLNMCVPALGSVKHYRPDAAGFLSVAPETFPQDFAADDDLVAIESRCDGLAPGGDRAVHHDCGTGQLREARCHFARRTDETRGGDR